MVGLPLIPVTALIIYSLLKLSSTVKHFAELQVFTDILSVITVRRYALHGLIHRNSVRPSVRLSVTLEDCVHMVRPTIMISSPYGSPIILVSGDITFIPKFEGGHPERGR